MEHDAGTSPSNSAKSGFGQVDTWVRQPCNIDDNPLYIFNCIVVALMIIFLLLFTLFASIFISPIFIIFFILSLTIALIHFFN